MAFALLMGFAIPALILGRSVLAAAVGVALICVLLSGELRRRQKGVLDDIPRLGLALVLLTFLAWLPNLVNSLDPLRSFEAAFRTIVFIAIAVLAWSSFGTDNTLISYCRRSLIVCGVVCALLGIAAKLGHPGIYWVMHLKGWRDVPLLTELKPLSALAPMLIPAFAWSVCKERGIWQRLAIIAIACFLILLFVTYNRAAMAGLLGAGVCVAVAVGTRRSVRQSLIIGLGVIVAAIAVVVLLKVTKYVPPTDRDLLLPLWLIDRERQIIWEFTWRVFQSYPIAGLGINTINLIPEASAIMPFSAATHIIPGHPHSWFFEILAETGVIGTLSLLTTVCWLMVRLLRMYAQTGSVACLAAIAASGGYWASGLFNFSFWSAWWQMSYFVIMAILLAGHRAHGHAGGGRAAEA